MHNRYCCSFIIINSIILFAFIAAIIITNIVNTLSKIALYFQHCGQLDSTVNHQILAQIKGVCQVLK